MKEKKVNLILLVIILAFVVIESRGLIHYDIGDENVYFYMGRLVTKGILPYKDFFFAHPPLKLLFITPVMAVFGFNLVALKLIPLTCVIISSIFLFKLMRFRFGDASAILTVLLFLFTKRIMLEATYLLGMNITTTFVIIGLYFLFIKRYFLSGIFYGIASISGLYSLVPFAVIFLFLLLKKRFKMFLLGFLVIFLSINIIMTSISMDYVHSVYIYHFVKPKIEGNNFEIIGEMVKENIVLFVLPVLLFFDKNRKRLLLILAISIAYFLFLTQIRTFGFYFVLLFPFLAMMAGCCLASLLKLVEHNKKLFVFLIVLLLSIFFVSLYRNIKHLYTFDFIDFQGNDKIVDFIKANSNKDDKLFGDVLTVPLIALETDRDIAFDIVDTNAMRFLSGSLDFDEVLGRIKEERVKFVIVRPSQGFGNNQKVADFLNENCKIGLQLNDKYWGEFFVFDCSKS